MATQVLHRPNRYAADCIRCGGRVPAGEGLLARTDTGAWAADHPGDCPEKPMAVASPVKLADEDGIYRLPDGTIYKVQVAHHGSGRLYAKRLVINGDKGTFEYAPGAIHTLRAEHRLDTDEAAKYGTLYGLCICCGATLTDEHSIARGIGPVCAKRYF
jgi:hypothetical protein